MSSRIGRGAVALALLGGLLAGCGGPARSPADAAACAGNEKTADTVRGIDKALQQGPILPAAVALVLLDSRARATRPGIEDPALAAAQAELVAAIDDLDAQGRALLPPGGNPAQNAVQLVLQC